MSTPSSSENLVDSGSKFGSGVPTSETAAAAANDVTAGQRPIPPGLVISHIIRQNIVASFPWAVHDNMVSNDVTITSSLRSDVIILGIFHFLSKNESSRWLMPKITKLCLH